MPLSTRRWWIAFGLAMLVCGLVILTSYCTSLNGGGPATTTTTSVWRSR